MATKPKLAKASPTSEEQAPPALAQQIELVPLRDLKPNPANPRINDSAVDAVARSIATYGFNNPIVTDQDLNIAAGHTRLKAAFALGLEVVPVIRVPGLTGSKFSGFTIADNATAEIARWDLEKLQLQVAELAIDTTFDLSALGFDDTQLTKLLDGSRTDTVPDEDAVPATPIEPFTQPGDLYILGEHRLLCGDATRPADLLRLLDGEKADQLLTDPPYGVAYHGRGEKTSAMGGLKNDDLDAVSLQQFIHKSLSAAASVMRRGATAYVCHAIGLAGVRPAFERAFLDAGFTQSSTIVWVKPSASMGWGDYREQYEPILYGWLGEGHRRITDRTQTTVWEVSRKGNYQHPTQKPVALYSRAMRNSTIRGESVLDCFAGSGTVVIAAEQLGRRAFALELEPKYCDVIVRRWEIYTGRKAEVVRDAGLRQDGATEQHEN